MLGGGNPLPFGVLARFPATLSPAVETPLRRYRVERTHAVRSEPRGRAALMPSTFDRFRKPGSPPPATSGVALVARERRSQAIMAGLDNLPSLPAITMEVLQLTQNPNAQAKDFEEILRRDQALTAKVLRLVNSPFFGLRREVTSIPQAIVVLGMRTLRSVVVAAQTSRLLDKQLGPYGLAEGGMWAHSMSCATLTRLLAKRAKLPGDLGEELFVGGLLHDVGKIILAPHVAGVQREFDAAVHASGGDVVRAENEVLGMTHPAAGGAMARKWGLAASLVALIEGHHQPFDPGLDARLAVVQMANTICNALGVGRTSGPLPPPADHPLRLALIGLGDEPDAVLEACRIAIDGLQATLAEMSRA